jgi:hypothetical protein
MDEVDFTYRGGACYNNHTFILDSTQRVGDGKQI